MSDHETQEANGAAAEDRTVAPPTQAQLYDDLRRIGQLEDQKQAIQHEIDQRTERLRAAIPTLDKQSLLYELLSKTMKPAAGPKKKRATPNKAVSKKRRTARSRK